MYDDIIPSFETFVNMLIENVIPIALGSVYLKISVERKDVLWYHIHV